MKRREFIVGLGSTAAWPLAVRAQQPAVPVVAYVSAGSADPAAGLATFRKSLSETGYVEGRNVTIEYHWLEGQYDRLPALMEDLVRRRVAVIATPASTRASIAAALPDAAITATRRRTKSAISAGRRSYWPSSALVGSVENTWAGIVRSSVSNAPPN